MSHTVTSGAPARLLTPKQAAERLGLSTSTLAKKRCLSSAGPMFVRLGTAIRYPEDAIEEYIAAQPRRRSTSDRPSSST
ncbi:MAG: helix-turn-helix domain-containing protein [Gemmatimonadota bacterium]|nr:helix-turn-helix domain-containing protein [Gemmatimonadota bacterium]